MFSYGKVWVLCGMYSDRHGTNYSARSTACGYAYAKVVRGRGRTFSRATQTLHSELLKLPPVSKCTTSHTAQNDDEDKTVNEGIAIYSSVCCHKLVAATSVCLLVHAGSGFYRTSVYHWQCRDMYTRSVHSLCGS